MLGTCAYKVYTSTEKRRHVLTLAIQLRTVRLLGERKLGYRDRDQLDFGYLTLVVALVVIERTNRSKHNP